MSLGSVVAETAALVGMYGDDKGDTAPTTWLWHLFTGDPTGAGVECTGTDYAPVSMANTDAALGATPTDGQLGPVLVDFGTAGAGGWGTPDYIASTNTGGDLFNVQLISDPDTVDDGDPVTVTVTINAA